MTAADVVVVGGGPAGAAAAITLARAGRDVLVIDRARFPRDKCCGDGLTTTALRWYERLGLDPSAVASWHPVDDVVVRSPSGRVVRFPLPRRAGTYAAVARRADLDAAFLDVARRAGARVADGHGLIRAGVDGDAVTIEADGLDTVRSHYAIGADGMWSPLRKVLGADDAGYLGEWQAFRQYLTSVGPAAEDLWVWFEPDLLPGYAWSFPLGEGVANVGFGVPRGADDRGAAWKRRWETLLDRPHIRAVLGPDATAEATHKAWPIPARVDRSPLSAAGGRALFAGDAARATDPMTGEGIAQALETGVLAAEAVLAAGPGSPAHAASRYAGEVHRQLSLDHRLAAALSTRVLRHRKGARAAIRVASTSPWTRRNFARWLFEDYPRAVLATPRRWRRGMLTGPGAFRD